MPKKASGYTKSGKMDKRFKKSGTRTTAQKKSDSSRRGKKLR